MYVGDKKESKQVDNGCLLRLVKIYQHMFVFLGLIVLFLMPLCSN